MVAVEQRVCGRMCAHEGGASGAGRAIRVVAAANGRAELIRNGASAFGADDVHV